MSRDILAAIKKRRSVREFLDREVDGQDIITIMEAGRWAPSGLNNQPWKFIVVKEKGLLSELASFTHYGNILEGCNFAICVFLDLEASYDRDKDAMAIGAANQNMLLAAESLGLGGVWLGQILANKEKVREALEAPESLELMAVLAMGYPVEKERKSSRKGLEELAFLNKFGDKIGREN